MPTPITLTAPRPEMNVTRLPTGLEGALHARFVVQVLARDDERHVWWIARNVHCFPAT